MRADDSIPLLDTIRHVSPWTLRDGLSVTIRPMRLGDEPLMVTFHQALSKESVYFRYFQALELSQRVSHERRTRICSIGCDRGVELVADRRDPATGTREILGEGQLGREPGTDDAEFALIIRDDFQGRGLGTELLRKLIEVARDEPLRRIVAGILPQNRVMQSICAKLGFHLGYEVNSGVIRAVFDLAAAPGR